MVPVVALTVAVVTVKPVAGVEPEVSHSVRPTAPAIRTTTTPTMGQRYRRQTEGGSAARTFSSSSGNSSVRSTGFSGASTASVFAMRPVQTGDFTVSRIPAVSPLGVLSTMHVKSRSERSGLYGSLSIRTAGAERTHEPVLRLESRQRSDGMRKPPPSPPRSGGCSGTFGAAGLAHPGAPESAARSVPTRGPSARHTAQPWGRGACERVEAGPAG